MNVNNNAVFTALPANANQNSKAQWADKMVRVSFQMVATGTAAGTLQAQGSNDQAVGLPANQFAPTNWSNIGSPVTVAGVGVYLIPQMEVAYEYVRLTYVDTSSGTATGTISARMKNLSF